MVLLHWYHASFYAIPCGEHGFNRADYSLSIIGGLFTEWSTSHAFSTSFMFSIHYIKVKTIFILILFEKKGINFVYWKRLIVLWLFVHIRNVLGNRIYYTEKKSSKVLSAKMLSTNKNSL